ncbi:kinase-like domain-containing protein [Mrakia frigida]|uniref:serine/threonine-protein kinase n=1 Tax=Mrakia frigida TaxID=29902 RepID=UPI003FCC1E95
MSKDTESPPVTPGSPSLSSYGGSESASNNPSRAPSRATSVKRDPKSPSLHPSDANILPASALAEKLSSASISTVVPNGAPLASPTVTVASGNEHKFNLKDLLNSGPKLSRKASAGSAASKSEKGKSNNGSEKGGHDGGSTASLLAKYGVCEKAAIGKGATAVVRLAHKWDRREEKLYAVKEFRKRRKNETEKDYVKKLTSEFCISSTLHHPNIVETVDLVQDEAQHWCEVMEYCPGGDLYAAIKKGTMSSEEVECYFKQILDGVAYLHSTGVAHRDIKPENLLLDGRGRVKITDFGVSDVFRMCWEKKTHLSKGLCGSEPYIAPEQFEQKEYDARLVDVWACGVVFYCMQLQELPWGVARKTDRSFTTYVGAYHSEHLHAIPAPLNNLAREGRSLIKHMLDPDPKTRWGIEECLKDKWLIGIDAKRQVKEVEAAAASS